MYGQIYLINNEDELRKMIVSGIDTIAITDDGESFKFTPVLLASILLPPYESVEAETNGDMETAKAMYIGWLSKPSCMKCLVTIITALWLGKSIGLYIPYGESKAFSFGATLMDFINMTFGIQVADMCGYGRPAECLVNPEAEPARLNIMFAYETISIEQFARSYPEGVLPSDFVSNKIVNMYGGNFGAYDTNQLRTFAMKYLAQVRKALGINRNLIVPVMRG